MIMGFFRDFFRAVQGKKQHHTANSFSPTSPEVALSEERLSEFQRLEKRLDYRFKNPALFERALTHKSLVYERSGSAKKTDQHYEALEFLGDSILSFVISEFLFLTYPTCSEGELSKIRSFLVSANQISLLSKDLGLGDFLRLSHGEEKTGGRGKKAILADLFESLIAAIHLDGGLESSRHFILSQFQAHFKKIAQKELQFKDHKSTLQERLHLLGLPEPRYRIVSETGPQHEKQFLVEVQVNGKRLARAEGKSKKEAQQRAAQIAIETLNQKSN